MIPKTIHYCWFGRSEKPKIVLKCIESWQKHCPDYKIIEWNEDNYDINCNQYVKESYENKNYAYVSDYVRADVLYNLGGIYLDTDTEVFKSLDVFLSEDSFWGFEEKNYIATSTIGCKKGNLLLKMLLDFYENKSLKEVCENKDTSTNVKIITIIFENLGIEMNGKKQSIDNIGTIYPQEYFSPYDYINFIDKITDKTYTKHYFYKSWIPLNLKIKNKFKKVLIKIIGINGINKLRELIG